MAELERIPTRPRGPIGAHTRAMIAYRAAVRRIAERLCDDQLDGGEDWIACAACEPCRARLLIERGEA